jgi:predicted site-specific integrase-resolvase
MAVQERLTSSQAARELGISSVYVRRLADTGHLPVMVTPLGRLYDAEAVKTLAAERRQRREAHES